MFNSLESFTPKQTQKSQSGFFNSKKQIEKFFSKPLATPQIKTQPIMLHDIETKIYSKILTTKNHVQITKLLELYKIKEVTFLIIQHMTNLQ